MKEKVIFDCDNTMGIPLKEVDDGLTLLYLLGVPEIELIGITTTFGNGSIDQVFSQTKMLKNLLMLDVPVFKGEGFRGQTPDTPAARFLVETISANPHQITLLTTGPVGNLHAASKLDPNFYLKIKRIAAMGGYLEPLKLGYRNLPELNFSANPEATFGLLNSPTHVTVFPGQACLDASYTFQKIHKARWWSKKIRWDLIQWLLAFGLFCGVKQFYLWDLLPAVFLTKPKLFNLQPFSLRSTTEDLEKGLLVEGDTGQSPFISLATGIRQPNLFYQLLEKAWQQSAQKYPL